MGEIKGQLLGIVLVLSIFGIVATALTTAFNNVSDDVVTKIESSTEITPAAQNNDLLSFWAK